jgi:small subunit ribosomal protein S7
MEVEPERKLTLAVRWILDASSARAGKSYAEKLAGEVMDGLTNKVRQSENAKKHTKWRRQTAFSHFGFKFLLDLLSEL